MEAERLSGTSNHLITSLSEGMYARMVKVGKTQCTGPWRPGAQGCPHGVEFKPGCSLFSQRLQGKHNDRGKGALSCRRLLCTECAKELNLT